MRRHVNSLLLQPVAQGYPRLLDTVLHLWDRHRPVDFLSHWHPSLLLSCLDDWHLVLHRDWHIHDLVDALYCRRR